MKPDVLEKLLDIGRKMAENRIIDPLLEYAMGVALELVDAERGYIVLQNADKTLNFRIKLNRKGEELNEPEEQISHTIFEKVVKTRKPVLVADAIADPDYCLAESVTTLQLRSVMSVPLISRGRLIGAIYVENRSDKGVFQEEDSEPLEFFAAQAAVAIENALLNDDLESRVATRTADLAQINEKLKQEIEERKRAELKLHKLSITDPLTKIYNRRHFFDLAEKELDRTKRYETPLSVILIDIDNFKRINDTYGHVVGDHVLRTVTGNIAVNLREVDIFARYGGEEFIILLPETSMDEAGKVAERLRGLIHAAQIEISKDVVSVTISLGVVGVVLRKDISLDELLDLADQALYHSKEAGRNRVCVWKKDT
ncbi:MAG: diguanylate cyclase [Anaerolineaceae bacterium]|nr:diguanylate cyclase [Anaerolineaceae bacterium]